MSSEPKTVWTPPPTPFLAVDVIIHYPNAHVEETEIVVIQRAFPPLGTAFPGGFVDIGESARDAAIREAREETGLDIIIDELIGEYSSPSRDPRAHVVSLAFLARPRHLEQRPVAGDDAKSVKTVQLQHVHQVKWVMDHGGMMMVAKALIEDDAEAQKTQPSEAEVELRKMLDICQKNGTGEPWLSVVRAYMASKR